jgi:hypothetical protein
LVSADAPTQSPIYAVSDGSCAYLLMNMGNQGAECEQAVLGLKSIVCSAMCDEGVCASRIARDFDSTVR